MIVAASAEDSSVITVNSQHINMIDPLSTPMMAPAITSFVKCTPPITLAAASIIPAAHSMLPHIG